MRAFIGVALPESIRTSLHALQQELAESRADLKWVEPEQLHLTLKFLDEITEEQRQQVETMLRRVTASATPFMVQLDQVGAFPSRHAPRVIWVGLAEGTEELARMAAMIEEEARAMGLRREERPFASHLTVGRVRSSRSLKALAQQLPHVQWKSPAPWHVVAITLYQSVLSSAGAHHSKLAEISFAQ